MTASKIVFANGDTSPGSDSDKKLVTVVPLPSLPPFSFSFLFLFLFHRLVPIGERFAMPERFLFIFSFIFNIFCEFIIVFFSQPGLFDGSSPGYDHSKVWPIVTEDYIRFKYTLLLSV